MLLKLDVALQHVVDAGLVAGALLLEIVHHPLVQADADGLLLHGMFDPGGVKPELLVRGQGVGVVQGVALDVLLAHALHALQVRFQLPLHTLSAPSGSPAEARSPG